MATMEAGHYQWEYGGGAPPARPYDPDELRAFINAQMHADVIDLWGLTADEMLAYVHEHLRRQMSAAVIHYLCQHAAAAAAEYAYNDMAGVIPRNVAINVTPQNDQGYIDTTVSTKWAQEMLNDEAQEMGKDLLDKVRELSSFRFFSLDELADMGHPYSTKYAPGAAGIPDYLINVQSGNYLASWTMTARQDVDTVVLSVENWAPYAPYLHGGTNRMRARKIGPAALEMTKDLRHKAMDRVTARVRRRVRNILRGGGDVQVSGISQ
jgi:hypothetical protein